jgi:hypothetical protein
MALHELIYVSLADHAMTPDELRALLAQARIHNREHGITGLLIYRDREFMQLIEGEQDEVLALYRHIENDPRHRQMYRIWEGPIAKRSCQDWAMGYAEPADQTWHALPDGRQVLDDGLFAAGQSSAGKRLLLRLRDEFLSSAGA